MAMIAMSDEARAREMRSQGMTIKAIGQALHRTNVTVSRWVKDVPVERRRNAAHSVETRDAARQMRRDGCSLTSRAVSV
jgi:IS30 family transposase